MFSIRITKKYPLKNFMLKHMYNNVYEEILAKANFGFVYCKILYNTEGIATDLRIINSNDSFIKLFNLEKTNIINCTFSQLFPHFFENSFKHIALYCKVAKSEPNTLEQQFPSIDKYLNIQPQLHQNDCLSILYNDITNKYKIEKDLKR